MAQMRMSQATEQALTDLRNDIHHISPTNPREQILYTNILKDFKTLASLRHDRLSDTESSLPNIFWIVLMTGSIVGLLFAMLLGTEKFGYIYL